jgi:hypothetical protein
LEQIFLLHAGEMEVGLGIIAGITAVISGMWIAAKNFAGLIRGTALKSETGKRELRCVLLQAKKRRWCESKLLGGGCVRNRRIRLSHRGIPEYSP